ncbi:MAG: helix-turn-helix transcriptional regulator [Anaerolineae bacterium]|nr:helix-turn-helix transcriptional regulator [Anaerolineae bacterium]
MSNIKSPEKEIGQLLKIIQPVPRLKLLLAIGHSEACVCHLEARLGYRQAYISQHLMALRKAKLLLTRREGRYIYYRLAKPAILEVLGEIAQLMEIPAEEFTARLQSDPLPQCCCPHCAEQAK